jgi:hypothetical protein
VISEAREQTSNPHSSIRASETKSPSQGQLDSSAQHAHLVGDTVLVDELKPYTKTDVLPKSVVASSVGQAEVIRNNFNGLSPQHHSDGSHAAESAESQQAVQAHDDQHGLENLGHRSYPTRKSAASQARSAELPEGEYMDLAGAGLSLQPLGPSGNLEHQDKLGYPNLSHLS